MRVLGYGELKKRQRKLLRRHFGAEIFPVLTPLAFDPGHPFPYISDLSLNLAVVLEDPTDHAPLDSRRRFARGKVPASRPRGRVVPDGDRFVVTEDIGVEEQTDEEMAPERFLVVVNWFEELRARMGSE